jgi:hypothetical protein
MGKFTGKLNFFIAVFVAIALVLSCSKLKDLDKKDKEKEDVTKEETKKRGNKKRNKIYRK